MHFRRSLIASALPLALLLGSATSWAFVTVGVSITLAPPVLPVYTQPAMPAPGYIWTPGYWAWSEDSGYYWVPGTWVEPPEAGLLWTPGYWGWANGVYDWNAGYWGPRVGFYGGVNYGFGYGGVGYAGGHWDHGAFFYNRAVNNIPASVHVTNVYNKTVINNVTVNRVSYNGGAGGLRARPSQAELAAAHEHHVQPIAAQERQEQVAQHNPQLRASANHGRPPIAATSRAGAFTGQGVVAARYASGPVPSGRSAEQRPHATAAPEGASAERASPEQHASPEGRAPQAPSHENASTPPRPQAHEATHAAPHAASHAAPHTPTPHAASHAAAPHAAPHAAPSERRSTEHPSEHANEHRPNERR